MEATAKAGLSFDEMGKMLSSSTGLGKHFQLVKWKKREQQLAASDVFKMTDGIYIIHALYYHAEDIDYKDAEAIDHYMAYNAGTRMLFLYPEVCDSLDFVLSIVRYRQCLHHSVHFLRSLFWSRVT